MDATLAVLLFQLSPHLLGCCLNYNKVTALFLLSCALLAVTRKFRCVPHALRALQPNENLSCRNADLGVSLHRQFRQVLARWRSLPGIWGIPCVYSALPFWSCRLAKTCCLWYGSSNVHSFFSVHVFAGAVVVLVVWQFCSYFEGFDFAA